MTKKKIRITKVIALLYMVTSILFFGIAIQNSKTDAVSVKLNTFSLYGNEHKIVYCNDHCTYYDWFKQGASTWNAYKKGVCKKWVKGSLVTCRVQDLVEISSMNGRTYASGFIVFNPNNMRKLTKNEKIHVATHEIGHALGLGHNQYEDVMYAYQTSYVKLTKNDKASFDAAFKKFNR